MEKGISKGLLDIGLRSGDIFYVRASLKAIGVSDIHKDFLDPALEIVGSGAIIAPAFTRQFPVWMKDPPVSDQTSKPVVGGLANALLTRDRVVRSAHPTHSFVGIGPAAAGILEGHNASQAAFEPMRKIVSANGLMALIGCVSQSPGFSTVHLVQYDLGLSQRHYLKFLYRTRLSNNQTGAKFWRLTESPGCSMGFGKFYRDYIDDHNFASGYIGNAWSIAVRAKRAHEIEELKLRDNPRYAICDNPRCVSCSLRGYNKRSWPRAIVSCLSR